MKTLTIILTILLVGCSGKIPRIQSKPAPIHDKPNVQLQTVVEPLTNQEIQNTEDVVVTHVNDVFTYFIILIILLCGICAVPNLIHRHRANRRLKNQLDRNDSRIVLND